MEGDRGPVRVTFFPPLHHQRRMWILDILRRERITEIIDIGCGEGALLATLCQPAPWLRPNHLRNDDDELSALFCNVGLNDEETPDLHAVRIAGLDISTSQLEIAVQSTSPASVNPLYTRWDPLDVELWWGSVDAINPAFVNAQCIVASELIEHLTEDVLTQVAPIVLGIYRPRLFLVTTPSYTFNRRWSPPGLPDPQGHFDPTGRTDRVFRHFDHKFEWTVEEFVHWCKGVAHQWGYVVETTTIGMPKEQDPWGRDVILGAASQVASFKRLDGRFSKTVREDALATHNLIKEPHTLVAKHRHEAHPRSGHPSDSREIEEAIILKFQSWREKTLGVQELWFADNLPVLCGGSIDVLLAVVEQSTELELLRIPGQRCGNWKIQLVGGFTNNFPQYITPMETESVVCKDDGSDYDVEEYSFDSGIHMGPTNDGTSWRPEDIDWGQVNRGENSWTMSCDKSGVNAISSEWERGPWTQST